MWPSWASFGGDMMSAENKAAWLSARCGMLTASRMAAAMGKKGPAARNKLLFELLQERVTGDSVSHFVSPAMEHGNEYEDEMFDVFVERYPQYNVQLSRFYPHPTIEYCGATPDREIGDDGLLEGKAPTTGTFLGWVLDDVVPAEHMPQMGLQLACARRKWCGFVAYDPRIKDEKRRLFVKKYEPTAEYLALIETEAERFLRDLDALFERFVDAA